MRIPARVTIFLGCGFAAKYREGGGNFSVPLQWMLGLQRLNLDAIWLELLPAAKSTWRPIRPGSTTSSGNCVVMDWPAGIVCCIRNRQRARLSPTRCAVSECQNERCLIASLAQTRCSISVTRFTRHFFCNFERRILCDLDPSEIFYWMTKMELGQSCHDEFWTIGLNVKESDCQLPKSSLRWKTFYPLADTKLLQSQPRPRLLYSPLLATGTGAVP